MEKEIRRFASRTRRLAALICALALMLSLCPAALGAEGTTRVSELRHIRRGYQALDKNLRALGADIREIP